MAIGSVVGRPVAVEGRTPVVTVPVGSWIIRDVGSHDCESVIVAVAITLVTGGFDEVDEVDSVDETDAVGVVVGVEITVSEVVVVKGREVVGIVEEVDSVVFSGIEIDDEDDTGGGVEVGISVVVLDGT